MNTVLTIAGSDCSGGAGIQADLKTMTAHKVYGMSVITALTAQNTLGVSGIMEVTPDFVADQMDSVFKDIRPDAVKIGMVSNIEIIEVISDKLEEYKAENVVVDPVMVATSGSNLMQSSAVKALIDRLFPCATVITPNLFEAETLSGIHIRNKADMVVAAEKISEYTNAAVLIKGGHLTGSADDLLYDKKATTWFCNPLIDNPNTHGTGCTLSSAIACQLAKGETLERSVKNAKEYITKAISAGLKLGHGRGPLQHF